jgi:hypothetical protein
MNSILLSMVIFAIIFAGSIAGIALRRALPDEQLGTDSKEVVRLATGLIVTMSGLVIGMLVSSASSSYEAQKNQIASLASEAIIMDRMMQVYGPETAKVRIEFRQLLEADIDRIWPAESSEQSRLRPGDHDAAFYRELQLLAPQDASQTAVKTQILASAVRLDQSQWLMFMKGDQAPIPVLLLVVVVSWLLATFASFGLFAPPNSTVVTTFALTALAVSSALFIIMNLSSPFTGVLKLSSAPLRDALVQMSH